MEREKSVGKTVRQQKLGSWCNRQSVLLAFIKPRVQSPGDGGGNTIKAQEVARDLRKEGWRRGGEETAPQRVVEKIRDAKVRIKSRCLFLRLLARMV